MLSSVAANVHGKTGMKTLGMAVLFGIVALLGNLIVDWLTHAKPEPVELIGATIIGMVLALGFRAMQPKS